jgi:glycosyltransferase involved in cell wall biosynthesis
MASQTKRVLLVCPFHGGSHRYWCEVLDRRLSEVDFTLVHLPPRHVAWRLGGAPLSLYRHEAFDHDYDLVLATSFLDLSTWAALNPRFSTTPKVLYFHENQFAYPWTKHQQGEVEAQLRSIYSSLVADTVAFNSEYNRKTFLEGASKLLTKLPDKRLERHLEEVEKKSEVVAVPIEFPPTSSDAHNLGLILLWNHRWEHDKGPDFLLRLLRELKQRGTDYRLNLIGESFREKPEAFQSIREESADRLDAWGYQQSRDEYWKVLKSSTVVLSTARHEFQGLSVLEAMSQSCIPCVPDALVYPDYVPDWGRYAKGDVKSAADRLEQITKSVDRHRAESKRIAERFSWDAVESGYRTLLRL